MDCKQRGSYLKLQWQCYLIKPPNKYLQIGASFVTRFCNRVVAMRAVVIWIVIEIGIAWIYFYRYAGRILL